MGAHAVAAHPQYRHLGDIHQKEGGAVEAHKQMVDFDGVGGVVAKHLVQALFLTTLLVKRTDDAHAHDVFAQHHVHAVDKALQAHKNRSRVGNRKDRRNQHDRNHDAQKHAHGRIDEPGEDDACHRQERHRQHQLNGLQNRLLNHVDVVERARDHRTRAKALKVTGRQLERLVVDGIADIAGHVGGQARRKIAAQHRATAGHAGRDKHVETVAQNVVDIARGDTGVDHVRQHRGYQQCANVVD